MIADISERPASWARTADVARAGIVARLAAAGLGGCPLETPAQVRTGLVSLCCCAAVFVGFGAAVWSQLTIGWQWSAPDTRATTVAMVMMSAAMLAFGALALTAAVPVAVAAFAWASTLSFSSYWVHPSALASFPAAELAWMALSPLALAGLAGGAATVVRRTELSPRILDFEARLGTAACAAMVVFLAGCGAWMVDGGPGPGNLFRAGAIDVAGAVVLTIAFVAASKAARTARHAVLR